MQKEKDEEDNNRSFEILYEHIAIVEKLNEEIKKKREIVKARITEPTKLGDIEKYLFNKVTYEDE